MKAIFALAVALFIFFGLFASVNFITGREKNSQIVISSMTPSPAMTFTALPKASLSATPNAVIDIPKTERRRVEQEVPFTVQAPRHNWKDIDFQNACEEAVVLMAMRWVYNQSLTADEAYVEIAELSEYSQRKYGFHLDQAALDVARLMKDYFGHRNIRVVEDVNKNDIVTELYKGNIVLAPVNGRKLNNPYFTQPGPIQHFLLIKGYDPETKVFITNDPGIGKGNGYRYPEDVLEEALRQYPTGYHEPITKVEKVMIVVGKSKD